jgi:hypothetical protein
MVNELLIPVSTRPFARRGKDRPTEAFARRVTGSMPRRHIAIARLHHKMAGFAAFLRENGPRR